MSNTAWALAKIAILDRPFLQGLGLRANWPLWGVQELVNTAWAFAKVAFSNATLWIAIPEAAVMKLQQFTPQDLASMAWAFATILERNMPVLDAFAEASMKLLA